MKTPSNDTAFKSTPDSADSTTAAQRQRLLTALRLAPISTIAARKELDILGVAQRIIELRKDHDIETVWINAQTESGKSHRVALYVLKPSGGDHDE